MNLILQANKLLCASLILFLIVVFSCNRSFQKSTRADPKNIIIIGSVASSDSLIMRDDNGDPADTFKVNTRARIQWLVIDKKSIAEITKIYKKSPTDDDVFSSGPEPIGGSLNWRGTIDRRAGGKTERYNVDWTDSNGGKHTFDPLIKVNP